jgi:CRISPR/Cas system-associated endoribonuclease Cas2
VAKAMEAVGGRVQDSVFEAWLSAPELEKHLRKFAEPSIISRICKNILTVRALS